MKLILYDHLYDDQGIKLFIKILIPLLVITPIFSSDTLGSGSEYDFVVVGAGAAGCVVAARLSTKFSVLLLEAGSDPDDPEIDVPAKTANFMSNEKFVKSYKTVPQSNAGLLNNGTFVYLVGRTVGGGTSVNGQVYNRGSPKDYDNWGNLTGDSSWNYDNLLEHFKRIEDYIGQYPSEKHHGKGGPLPISQPKYSPGLDTWLEAGKALGYSETNSNSPQSVGFAPIEFNRRHGRRVSAYQGYIKPILATRSSLKVIKNAKVEKVIFEGNKAVGVKYTNEFGDEIEIGASKEVIISAGALESPIILMKSRVGPKDVLDYSTCSCSKMPAVKYLPVGHNLQDHVYLTLYFNVKKDKAEVFDPARDLNPEAWKLYEETGDGPYSSFMGIFGQAFLVSSVRTQEKDPNPKWADINLHLLQTPSRFQIDGMADTDVNANEDSDEVSIATVIMLTRPKSRGRVVLNPENVKEDPLIDFQYLAHPDDMVAMIDAVKQVIRIFEEALPYQKQSARYSTPPLHFCKSHEFRSDEYWRCYISYMTTASAHAAGTCRMGAGANDPDAVVDSKLKVIGIENLRVIDTSIMPAVTNANTQAPALLIGEKGAAEILKHWKDVVSSNVNHHQEL